MKAFLQHKALVSLLVTVTLALGLSGCKFNGAYDLPLPGGVVSKGDSVPLTAQFTDALNVVPRTAVMLDDVPVGQVTQIDRKGWNAQVQMRVRKDLDLPENITLDVRQTSLLGEKYIAIVRPTEPTGKLQAPECAGLVVEKRGRLKGERSHHRATLARNGIRPLCVLPRCQSRLGSGLRSA